jgi:hypothetical protein
MPIAPPKSKKRNPSILNSLGISVQSSSAGTPRVVSSDARVQRIIDSRKGASEHPKRLRPTNPNLQNVMDLHRAARQGNILDIDILLRDCPDIVNLPSSSSEDTFGAGGTSLHYATVGCQPGTLFALLRQGAEPNVGSTRLCTPLHVACMKGFVECAIILMDHGANMLQADSFGVTPLSILNKACGDTVLLGSRKSILLYYKRLKKVERPGIPSRILAVTDHRLYKHP